MILFLAAVIIGLGIGLLRGGSLAHLEQVRLRGELALLVLLVLQMALPAVATRLGLPVMLALGLWLLAMAGLVVLALINVHQPGMLLAAVGVAFNLMAIGLNAGMPVSERAARIVARSETVKVDDLVHRPMDDDTLLPWLTDVIPLPGPGSFGVVVSIGDVLLVAGVGWFLSATIRPSVRPSDAPKRGSGP